MNTPIRYISLFSGVECASLAARGLDWVPLCFSEIDPFPSAVLAHRFPDVPNVGDVAAHDWTAYRGKCDLVCGGSPCQSFSIAGLRGSLSDSRGNLTLEFARAVDAIDPAVIVWENVVGVLNTPDNAFGCFLAALAGHDQPLTVPGGKWGNAGVVIGPRRRLAWRVFDAQFFGVPQRRRRIFLVASPGTAGIDPCEILFEAEGLSGNRPAGKKTGEEVAGTLGGGSGSRGYANSPDVAGAFIPATAPTVLSKWSKGSGGPAGDECQNLIAIAPRIAHTLRGEGFDAGECGDGRGTPLVTMVFDTTQITSPQNGTNPKPGSPCHALAAGAHAPTLTVYAIEEGQINRAPSNGPGGKGWSENVSPTCLANGKAHAVAFQEAQTGVREYATAGTLRANGPGHDPVGTRVRDGMTVRRLTPRECERLQGMPDDWTLIPWRIRLRASMTKLERDYDKYLRRGGRMSFGEIHFPKCADGPRYKAIGNGWPVPMVRWLFIRVTSAFKRSGARG